MGTWTKRFIGLGCLYGIPILLYILFRYVVLGILPGHKVEQSRDQWFMGNLATFGPTFWVFLAIWSFLSVIVCVAVSYSDTSDKYSFSSSYSSSDVSGSWLSGGFFGVLCITSIVLSVVFGIAGSKELNSYYARSVTFYVPNLHNIPQSLTRLTNGAHMDSDSSCLTNTKSDVPNCVRQGSLNQDGWDPRVSSLDGARYGLSHSASFKQHVSLNGNTVEYLNAWHGQPARWSGILDGSGGQVAMGGVAEWNGHKVINQCDFDGKYDIDRAFDGNASNDMSDLLAEKYPAYNWTIDDVWGYCDGKQPIVIVPMAEQAYYDHRTVNKPAGFVIVQGDHGKTKLTFKSNATPGEYPGPVYPASMVDRQLTASQWAAGRKNQNQNGFGYESASAAAQAGNVKDYLLRDKVTGRLEWVTPLTLRGTSSEVFVAYAVSYADQIQGGSLNPLHIYLLGNNDPREINIDSMDQDARNFLATQVPGFAGQGGKLLEFTPVGGNIWRGYGEINGRVEYLLDIDATNVNSSILSNIGGSTGTSGSTADQSNKVCGQPLSSLTASELTNCLKLFADQLANQQGGATTSN